MHSLSHEDLRFSYRVALECYAETSHLTDKRERVRACRVLARSKCQSVIGAILLAVVIQLISRRIVRWIEDNIINPPSEMPNDFGTDVDPDATLDMD